MELRWTEMKYCDLYDLCDFLSKDLGYDVRNIGGNENSWDNEDFYSWMSAGLEASNGSYHCMPDADWWELERSSDEMKKIFARAKELVGDEMIYISW